MVKNKLKIIEKISQEILKQLDIEKFSLKLEETEGMVKLNINTDDSNLLIGHFGENIASLQLLIGLLSYKKIGEWQKIAVNVNDWREKREEYLHNLAANMAQKVTFSHLSVKLPLLTASERRLIHLYLADNAEVETVSEGEGSQRRLIIRPKSTNSSEIE